MFVARLLSSLSLMLSVRKGLGESQLDPGNKHWQHTQLLTDRLSRSLRRLGVWEVRSFDRPEQRMDETHSRHKSAAAYTRARQHT